MPRFHPDKIEHVEDLDCPAMLALHPRDPEQRRHRLENVRGGRDVECVGCGVPWRDLDAALRVGRPRRV